jgi:hypothetical protein
MTELHAQPTSVQSVYSWYANNKLYVNRRYQRKLVWTLEEKQKLIESISKRYPIPAILLAERESDPGTYEIIDGLQRLHAIVSFIETAFPTLDNSYFAINEFPTAKNRADEGLFEQATVDKTLSQKEVSAVLDYVLAVSMMRNASENEINDVFGRINSYGHQLSDQERRQAGVQSEFSDMVRTIACTLRGDVSTDVLSLSQMPSISIDLPKTKHGYLVQADEVFWVVQGILRSTDLRDSMDEQCIADIAASIVGGEMLERSKDALDSIYTTGNSENARVLTSLEVYGSEKFAEEFKYCVDELLKVSQAGGQNTKLKDLLFKKATSNAFPSTFAVILIAFHELIVKEKKLISNHKSVMEAVTNISERIDTGKRAALVAERRKNINAVKGLIGEYFIPVDNINVIYGNHASTDIEAVIRRSEIELGNYELKQGLLTLADPGRAIDSTIQAKVVNTLCAIANNGPRSTGKLIIGVTDKEADANRVQQLDGVTAKKVGKRFVVGIAREAKFLSLTTEAYVDKWKQAIKNSGLSPMLRDQVLSHLDFNDFYGFGIIVLTVPPQTELSYVDDQVYWRNGDSTELATSPKQIAQLAKRF